MVCGIYLLRFNTDLVYIGQSRDIYRRYTTHCTKLLNGTHVNTKMAVAYGKYGKPTLEILCECSEAELDKFELEAIEIFDCITNGLNIAPAGGDFPILNGEKNPSSKYSDELVISLVRFLVLNKHKPLKVLAQEFGIHYSTVKNISNGTSHTWLRKVLPEEYSQLLAIKGTRTVNTIAGKGIERIAVSPEGVEYTVTNMAAFCKERGLNAGAFGEVMRKITKQHKGWTTK